MFLREFKKDLSPNSQHCFAHGVRNMKRVSGREDERICTFPFSVHLGGKQAPPVSPFRGQVFLKDG